MTNSTGSVTYNLQPPTASKMSFLVTVQPISRSRAASAESRRESERGAVLQTTTVIAE